MDVGTGLGTSNYILEKYADDKSIATTTEEIREEIDGNENYDYLSSDVTLSTILNTSLSSLNDSIGGINQSDVIYLLYQGGSLKYSYNVETRNEINDINDFDEDANGIISYDSTDTNAPGLLAIGLSPSTLNRSVYVIYQNPFIEEVVEVERYTITIAEHVIILVQSRK